MADIYLPGYPENMSAQEVTIAASASASEIIATQGRLLVGIFMPAAWTAADIAFKVGVNQREGDMKNIGASAITTPAIAAVFIAFPSPETLLVPFIQLVSVTAGTTTGVPQAAERKFVLLFRSATG